MRTGRQIDTTMLGALHNYANALDKHLAYSRHTTHTLQLILRWASTFASLSALYTPGGVLFLIRLRCTFNGTSTRINWCLAVLNNSPFPGRGLIARQFSYGLMRRGTCKWQTDQSCLQMSLNGCGTNCKRIQLDRKAWEFKLVVCFNCIYLCCIWVVECHSKNPFV